MLDSKLGIIGLGYVGTAIKENCDPIIPLCLIDPDHNKKTTGTYDEIMKCNGIFVCVPSPSLQDGTCDSSILEEVLSKLETYNGVIISKTTITPDIYKNLQNKYPNLIYCPEFLTERNCVQEYAQQNWIIVGGKIEAYQREAARLISLTKKITTIEYCSIEEAALVKYTINSFLATKVIFMNEMFALSSKLGLDWQIMKQLLSLDTRIGKSHLSVPGPDGQFGFGGSCFPKDTSALLSYARHLGVNLNILKEAVQKNTLFRLH